MENNDFKKIKKLEKQLAAAVFLFIITIAIGSWVIFGLVIKPSVQALTGDYSKGSTAELTAEDWNRLDDDFISVDGGTINGPLTVGDILMSNNNIILGETEGNIGRVDTIVGNNDLFLKGSPGETAPVYIGGSELKVYTGGIVRMNVTSAGIEVSGDIKTSGSIKYNTLSDWRLVYRDDFEDGSKSGWDAAGVSLAATTCGNAGILGGYKAYTGLGKYVKIKKTFNLARTPHGYVKVVLDYYSIDTWDANENEKATVYAHSSLDGDSAMSWESGVIGWDSREERKQMCGRSDIPDGVKHVELSGTHIGDSVIVTAISNLNDTADDESFGIDNVEIWVR